MQAINRIQNATVNANAAVQAALVVDRANAHRVYPSFKPCMQKSVSKCLGQMSMSPGSMMLRRSQKHLHLECLEHGSLTPSLTPGTWRPNRRNDQMPAMVWATFVLSPTISG